MRYRLAAIALGLVGASAAAPAPAKELSVALSQTVVAITTQFTGAELLLFGAKEGPGDIIVVVRGPLRDQIVRRKDKVSGIWINRADVEFDRIPAFYAFASNRPVEEILSARVRKIHQIGVDYLDLVPKAQSAPPIQVAAFREALIRNKQRDGLYNVRPGNVNFLTGQLFSTRIYFPANVSVGQFGVDVHLVRNQDIVVTETRLISVRKLGAEANIYDFAHRYPFAYGILAVLLAVAAGWVANAIFRKK
jgi:uncharacterized protein (TIGR02186 family)